MRSKYYYLVFWRYTGGRGSWAPFHNSHRPDQVQLFDSLREVKELVRCDRFWFPQMQHKIVKLPRPR